MRESTPLCLSNIGHEGNAVQSSTAPLTRVRDTPVMFHLITTVRRGTAASLLPTWSRYPTIETARGAAADLLREERVQRVMIVRDEIPQGFVEWRER